MESEKDYYALLGVAPDAPDAVIRAAFRTLVPDAQQDQPRFAQLMEAFATLKDPELRAEYDRTRPSRSDNPDRTRAATVSPDAGALRPVPKDDGRTRAWAAIPCSACGTPAPAGEIWCPECGLRCGTTAGERPAATPMLILSGGERWPLPVGTVVLGRDAADIVIADPSVSRRHACFTVDADGGVWLEDLGSTNGTKAAGQTIAVGAKASLADGTPVRFGTVSGVVSVPARAGGGAPRIAAREPEPSTARALPAGGATGPRLVHADGRTTPVPPGGGVVGRREGADIVLTGDAFVSGRHAALVRMGDGWAIEDLGSTNGTQVDGRPVTAGSRVALTDGVTMTLGRTRLTFRIS